jgi:RNA ligase (TIGR02306 family)
MEEVFERKLASIQRIVSKEKHENADSLELVTVLGWQVVCRIDETRVDDLVVYFEIDSLIDLDAPWLPETLREKLQKSKMETFRIKTIKLRGELSQGLIVPLSMFGDAIKGCPVEEGTDLTSVLKISKYDPPAFRDTTGVQGAPKISTFPSHLLRKTDEIRIQSEPKLFKAIQGKPYRTTMKYDGMSGTFVIDPDTGKFLVCSRNQIRTFSDSCPYFKIAEKYQIETILRQNPEVAIQGEVCGPKIQMNLLELDDLDFFVFNVVNIRTQRRMDIVAFCEKHCMKNVLILDEGESFECASIPDLVLRAEGKYPGTDSEREGLVIRSKDEKISFKVISNKHALIH